MTPTSTTPVVRPAGPADREAIAALLATAALPTALPAALDDFLVATLEDDVIGCAGIERHGTHGLLRSVAVAPAVRGHGVGERLVRRALVRSQQRADDDCWLGTVDAAGWWARFGFAPAAADTVPAALHGAIDHHGACPSTAIRMRRPSVPTRRILVLCTGNSARSQVGEALLATRGGALVHAASAGSRPAARVNPMAVRILAEHGIVWDGGTPKTIDSVAAQHWELVLTVCNNAKEACPILPGVPVMAHWGMPDPADLEPEAARHAAFAAVYEGLATAVDGLLDLLVLDAPAPTLRGAITALAPQVTFGE